MDEPHTVNTHRQPEELCHLHIRSSIGTIWLLKCSSSMLFQSFHMNNKIKQVATFQSYLYCGSPTYLLYNMNKMNELNGKFFKFYASINIRQIFPSSSNSAFKINHPIKNIRCSFPSIKQSPFVLCVWYSHLNSQNHRTCVSYLDITAPFNQYTIHHSDLSIRRAS